MLHEFYQSLRHGGLAVTVPEYMDLLRLLADKRIAIQSLDEFFTSAQGLLVKHESKIALYRMICANFVAGLEIVSIEELLKTLLPEEWLRKLLENSLSPEELAAMEKWSLDQLLERFQQLLQEQHERHEGGSKWIGTGGRSPFGAYGANPAGYRLAGPSRLSMAVKTHGLDPYAEFDVDQELSPRNMRLAMRVLRLMARESTQLELDEDRTIDRTIELDRIEVVMTPKRENAVEVLLFIDSGGYSMNSHLSLCQQLFTAARNEFRRLTMLQFHNCIYDRVVGTANNRRRSSIKLDHLFRTHNANTRVVIVGDAHMAPSEILAVNGSIDFMNSEPGATWIRRMRAHWPHLVWLNPRRENAWHVSDTVPIVQNLVENRMYPLTIAGLARAMKSLRAK